MILVKTPPAKQISIKIFNRCGYRLEKRFLLLLAISFVYLQLSDAYLRDLEEYRYFNYSSHGDLWDGICQHGQRQSPLELVEQSVITTCVPQIKFYNYNAPLQFPLKLINNGRTAYMELKPGDHVPYISGGIMKSDYNIHSVHFHWGDTHTLGSEHTLNYKRYDAEMHIVHKNSLYSNKSLDEVSKIKNGIAVLAVLIQAHPELPCDYWDMKGLNRVFKMAANISKLNSYAYMDDGTFTVDHLLGNLNTETFYTYHGSLTTPNCGESVIWTVFSWVTHVPKCWLLNLFKLKNSDGQALVNNWRHIQMRNQRQIFYRSCPYYQHRRQKCKKNMKI